MGWWVGVPAVAQGETLLWNFAANREQTINRSVGGRLFVTQHRLIFQPNRLDVLFQAESWSAELADIREVGKSPRRPTIPFLGRTAANRNRLKIVQAGGDVDLFVVNHLDSLVERLTAALS